MLFELIIRLYIRTLILCLHFKKMYKMYNNLQFKEEIFITDLLCFVNYEYGSQIANVIIFSHKTKN